MDRPLSLKTNLDTSPSSTTDPRLKPVQSFPTFQAHNPNINGPSPVRRKPLPSSASIHTPKVPPLSTGGKLVAVGEEDPDDQPSSSPFAQSFARLPWRNAPATSSPPLLVRDLDQ